MKFTDEQVMQYVDGEAGSELKTKMMKALEKKDKELGYSGKRKETRRMSLLLH